MKTKILITALLLTGLNVIAAETAVDKPEQDVEKYSHQLSCEAISDGMNYLVNVAWTDEGSYDKFYYEVTNVETQKKIQGSYVEVKKEVPFSIWSNHASITQNYTRAGHFIYLKGSYSFSGRIFESHSADINLFISDAWIGRSKVYSLTTGHSLSSTVYNGPEAKEEIKFQESECVFDTELN